MKNTSGEHAGGFGESVFAEKAAHGRMRAEMRSLRSRRTMKQKNKATRVK